MSPIGQLLRRAERQLANAGIGDPRIEADLIWMTALELDRAELYAALRDSPTPSQAEAAESLLSRRLNHEPAAYLMGHREFYGLDLVVAPGVLIPRPDTETLVEEALRLLAPRVGQVLAIADVGCGTGAIAVALAVHLPAAHVYAIDRSPRAIEITTTNAARHGVAERVHTLEGDMLSPLSGPVDLIAANLPYVASWEIPTLEPEVRMFEPREALDGGDDGLDLVRRLLTDLPGNLLTGGAALLEMDPRQIAAATRFASGAVAGASVRSVRDLAGRERVLVVEV